MTPDTRERRSEFCARLKCERERRATPLGLIAETTKVNASLLEALERGDVSRWPKGIYRRSFFRDYVTAIGLPADQHVAEFIELFPDGDETPHAIKSNGRGHRTPADPFRLTFAEDPSSWTLAAKTRSNVRLRVLIQQTVAATADIVVVVALAALLRTWLGGFLPAVGIIACVYYWVFTALFGRSLATMLLTRWKLKSTSLAALALRIENEARTPALSEIARRTRRGTSILREYASRLSSPPHSAKAERRRDLAAVRRRRAESANSSSSVDEISEVLG
ncbi:MAG TPA: helix-turn-helix domain-containing protein [Vicinamibacterales bacterium]|nr:helix-turn-helix domain-containing protein [Vicinamibacterales bacterium]